eukprot:CAMPEP_0198217784 /NCGR_PEP_ID=MMETSP1445-20131203/65802_1 /TAXON_ID=36898 /ORGANISM="Pyramimonas sp., Strain CCMP2087" /LENGTH=114 /DNA_ID=CAMNT_0043894593 /DNA_START=15 /DNA_END=359 /DNA_ORIENTATION=+
MKAMFRGSRDFKRHTELRKEAHTLSGLVERFKAHLAEKKAASTDAQPKKATKPKPSGKPGAKQEAEQSKAKPGASKAAGSKVAGGVRGGAIAKITKKDGQQTNSHKKSQKRIQA